jgi:hypothetical protein
MAAYIETIQLVVRCLFFTWNAVSMYQDNLITNGMSIFLKTLSLVILYLCISSGNLTSNAGYIHILGQSE